MAEVARPLAALLLAAGCSAWPVAGTAEVTANYLLTRPALPLLDPELAPRAQLFSLGPVRLATAGSTTGAGLSLQAGQQWFARFGVGRSIESDVLSLGGGYRFRDGHALSMHVTRQLGQERLGLAVRYDWTSAYLRLAYESPLRPAGGADTLRFSAGLRF